MAGLRAVLPGWRLLSPWLLLPLVSGCGEVFPWHRPAIEAYVSDASPPCPAEQPACQPLAPQAADSILLARLADAEIHAAADLERLTGMVWREVTETDSDLHIDLSDGRARDDSVARYVVELVRSEAARDSVLSIASNGGAAVWVNGRLLGSSRSVDRAARAHEDLYSASLRAGRNVILYKVLTRSAESQLHREWHGATSLPDVLAAAIDLGAFATLPKNPLLADTMAQLELLPSQVRLASSLLQVRFRWKSLDGEVLEEIGTYPGTHPTVLPLPSGFNGAAVLETQVVDAAGRVLYFEECPVFADSTARRMVRSLVAADTTGGDPVRIARVRAARAAFGVEPVPQADLADWLKVQILASLYRHVEQPTRFQHYPGPQVWGYRTADGAVQPYWLTVPASLSTADSAAAAPGLLFSATHWADPDYWSGRGRTTGFLAHLVVLSATCGGFGVLPHLGGVHDFDRIAGEELPAIVRQVAAAFPIDTAAVGLLAWSAHATEAVQLAENPAVPLAWVGLAVPDFPEEAEFARALASIRTIRPGLNWLVWQASGDIYIPRERTEARARAIRRAGFPVRYREVPHSTHLGGYFEDIEAELHRRVAARQQGAAGKRAMQAGARSP